MKRPLLPVTLAYVSGILLARLLSLPLGILFGATLGLVVVGGLSRRLGPWLFWPMLVLAGWTNLAWREAILSPWDLRQFVGNQVELVTLRGTLVGAPTLRLSLHGKRLEPHTRAVLETSRLRGTNGWEQVSGRVLVSTPARLGAEFYGGRVVEVQGVLERPTGPVAAGLFDYRRYLHWRGIYYELIAASPEDWQVATNVPSPSRPWTERFRDWARATLERGLPTEDEPLRLLWAMTLGWRAGLTTEVAEPFMRSGTMHIFAISGLHVALLGGILLALLRTLRLPRTVCGALVLLAVWGYAAVTGWQASAVRATVMLSVILVGWALARPSDLLNSLAAAAFILLLAEPRQLFQAGFQLSFCVVLSLAVMVPPLERLRNRWLERDPLLPAELLPGWRRRLDAPARWIGGSLAVSMAAWLGSLPLVALYFHLFTPVSLLGNLIVIPLATLALMASLGSLFCGAWCGWMTVLFNHSAWFWMVATEHASAWLANLPGACWHVRSPSPEGLIAYYAVLIGVASGWLLARGRRRWLALLLGIWGMSATVRWWHGRHVTQLTVLPAHGGAALYLDAPGRRHDVLIDAGNAAVAQARVKPLLQAAGVNFLATMVLTHGDVRHAAGAPLIADRFGLQQLVISPLRFRSRPYRVAVAAVQAKHRVRQVAAGQQVAGWQVLHPRAADHFARADDGAIVLRGNLAGCRVLLLSDLGEAGQQVLLQRTGKLEADVVVAGLPTRGEPLQPALLAAIQPRVIIINDDEPPYSARAPPRLRHRLQAVGVPLFYTSNDGTVTLTAGPGHWEVQAMSGRTISGGPGG